ncbi:MAG TPA: leucine--tRNA ligase, partial [Thermomicrobiales bacterium]|nr:leucine--tRNA ligase [Thermomicrobiales bacterium]
GLPAENAAIKRNIHPFTWTMDNIENMRRQMRSMGTMFDWDQEVITCTPEYYKWNQWIFLKLYEAGLAYRANAPVWWCPNDQTVLANEQVVDGRCERCGTEVYRRELEQWFFKITAYADELLDYDGIDWPEPVRIMQRNWIGRSEGARVTFQTETGDSINVFTTRPDTLWGATFMVLAPEHPLVEKLTTDAQRGAVEAYVQATTRETEIERQSTTREKTGVFTGGYATNPASGEQIPIWIADYVLMSYGTGAVMAVPAHDERDGEFALKFGLPIRPVIEAPEGTEVHIATTADGSQIALHSAYGTMINSGELSGTPGDVAVEKTIAWLEERGIGTKEVTYRLRDWLISRQRYWGTPIPMIYCDECGLVPVPEDDLPVLLPEDAEFAPTGESPLKTHPAFTDVECPSCGGRGRRETDTMDTFVDSSWYHYRYLSPHEDAAPFDRDMTERWTPVDQYTGGREHATMHLLYARFFTKALRDIGLVSHSEPYRRLVNQGFVLGEDSEKMSKSRGNVVDPDDLVAQMGADTVRMFLMFMRPWDQTGPWDSQGITGVHRFLERAFTVVTETAGNSFDGPDTPDVRNLQRTTHQTIRAVTEDAETFGWNTMVARLMEFVNELMKLKDTPTANTTAWREATETLALLLAPSAPHIAEELWHRLGNEFSVHNQRWPEWSAELAAEDTIEIAVQVNGKVRGRVSLPAEADEATALSAAREDGNVASHLDGKSIVKEIYVPGRLINFVVR